MPRSSFCLLIAFAVSALSLPNSGAMAQAAPQFGPPINGVCLFARKEALETSEPGLAIAARIAQAQAAVRNQVASEKNRIETELAGLRSSDSSRRMMLFEEMNTVNRFEADAQARIEQQTNIAYRQVEPAMEKALAKVVTREKCSLIVERSITYGWNSAMDITPQVIAVMNRKVGR